MAAHWKFGDGFAIRYGGYKDIQWFKGSEYESLAMQFGGIAASTFSPLNAVAMVGQTAGLFLQWWETHRQTNLQIASHEERRLGWLADILAVWHREIQEGTLRQDTINYLDREISRLLNKLQKSDLTDVPSSLLLQVERSANALVALNLTLNNLLKESVPICLIEGAENPVAFEYRPYFIVVDDDKQFEEYIDTTEKIIANTSTENSQILKKVAANSISFLGSVPNAVAKGIQWSVPKLLELKKKMKNEDRLEEFAALQNFAIELRSARSLIGLVQKLPPAVREYSPKEIAANGTGRVIPLVEIRKDESNLLPEGSPSNDDWN